MPVKVVAITQKLNHCTWWRIEEPFRKLSEAGHRASICWLDENDVPTEDIKNATLVLQRILIKKGTLDYVGEWVARLKKLGARKIIYELDDDILSDDYVRHMTLCGRATLTSLAQLEDERQRQIAMMRACDAVTVTTEALAKLVRKYISSSVDVHVLPNSLDLEWYKSKLKKNAPHQNTTNNMLDYVTVGWAGGLRPDEDYTVMAEAWGNINKKYPQVRFVIGGYQPNILYEAVNFDDIIRVPWVDKDDWPSSMQVDIACAPLADTKFNRCKSQIKVMEAVMSGAVPIASPTAYNIREFQSLPIATSVKGWQYYMELFINNWTDRQLTCLAVQDEIYTHFDLSKNYTKWVSVYS